MKRVITTLLFLRRGDEVLLAMKKRGHGVGHWNGVGGKPEPGETIEQTAVRECQEEIGVTPQAFEKVAECSFYEPHEGEQGLILSHVYICTEWAGEPVETEEMAPRWFKLTDIPYDHMWPDDPHWLPAVLEGQKLRTEFHYDDATVLQRFDVQKVESFHES